MPEPAAQPPILVVGSLNVDLVVQSPRFAEPGETLTASSFAVHTGGKGANQAAAATRLGYPTHLVAHLGQDALADSALAGLRAAGVSTDQLTRVPGATGCALITTVPSGENTILLVPGANSTLTPAALEPHRDRIATAGMVLAQLEIPLSTVERLAALCTAASTPLMLDPAPARPLPPALLAQVTWLTPNETEAAALTGIPPQTNAPDDHLARVADALLALGPKNVALKLGRDGAFLAGACGQHRIRSVPVDAIDTTAAGDCFNGAFAAALLQGHPPATAARHACAAAALSTTRAGALPSLPTGDEVAVLLAKARNKVGPPGLEPGTNGL